MPVTTKICGLSTEATLDAAIAHGAAQVGFVFFPPSPRAVDPARAAALVARVPAHVAKVGVFVDPDDALLDHAVATGIDTIQLHGRETPERTAAIKARHRLAVWRAISVRRRPDLDAARAYRGAADLILYDARTPDGAALPGGMGLRFDWHLLDGFVHPLPWILSGGLDAGNVGQAIAIGGARGVDTSSGVESAPGVKDVDKIAAFLQSVDRS